MFIRDAGEVSNPSVSLILAVLVAEEGEGAFIFAETGGVDVMAFVSVFLDLVAGDEAPAVGTDVLWGLEAEVLVED